MVDAVKLLGSLLGGMGSSSGGGIGSMLLKGVLNSALGGQSQQSQGGIGGLLGALAGGMGNQQQGNTGGGLGDLLGSLAGGASAQQGNNSGLGGLLGSLAGGSAGGASQSSMMGNVLMGALNQFIGGNGNAGASSSGAQLASFSPEAAPSAELNDQALVVLRAMFNAAKSDGQIDQQEYAGIVDKLDDDGISEEEKQFVEQELASPFQNADEFAATVPAQLQQSAYVASLCAITLDSNEEAQYLNGLAQQFGMGAEECNAIHQKMGAPALYQ